MTPFWKQSSFFQRGQTSPFLLLVLSLEYWLSFDGHNLPVVVVMTKKITSFFQVSTVTKNRKSGTVSGAKRDRDDGDDDCIGGNSAPARSKECRIDSSLGHVNDLLSFLSDDIGEADKESSTHPNHSWKNTLRKHFQSSSFLNLAAFVAREREIHKIYPPPPSIWSALNSCPLRNVKVVIVGQDPYHGIKQAHGLSFSVEPGCAVPPSLKNMYVNVSTSIYCLLVSYQGVFNV